MNIQPYIQNDLATPGMKTRIGELQELLNQHGFSHIPVMEDGVFMGCFSENDIRSFEIDKEVQEYQYALEGFFVRPDDNWIEVLHSFSKNQASLMPVLGEQNEYLGYLELHDIMNLFTEAPFLNSPGGIFIVEKGFKDYSFSEISQIVESNGAHVLGAFVSKTENDLTQITIKTGPTPINAILQAFRRYGYSIVSTHFEDSFNSSLEERSRYLDKYLNI